ALNIVMVGQAGSAELKLGIAFDIGTGAARPCEHAALCGCEQCVRRIAAAPIGKGAVLRHLREETEVLHECWLVNRKTCVEPVEPIILGGVRNVVPGGEGFQLNPGGPP